jgi:hypothetical protein
MSLPLISHTHLKLVLSCHHPAGTVACFDPPLIPNWIVVTKLSLSLKATGDPDRFQPARPRSLGVCLPGSRYRHRCGDSRRGGYRALDNRR